MLGWAQTRDMCMSRRWRRRRIVPCSEAVTAVVGGHEAAERILSAVTPTPAFPRLIADASLRHAISYKRSSRGIVRPGAPRDGKMERTIEAAAAEGADCVVLSLAAAAAASHVVLESSRRAESAADAWPLERSPVDFSMFVRPSLLPSISQQRVERRCVAPRRKEESARMTARNIHKASAWRIATGDGLSAPPVSAAAASSFEKAFAHACRICLHASTPFALRKASIAACIVSTPAVAGIAKPLPPASPAASICSQALPPNRFDRAARLDDDCHTGS